MFALNTKKLLTLIIILFATQATMIATSVNRKTIPAFKNLNHSETMVSSPVDWKVDQKMPVPFASFPILDVILMSIHATSVDIYHNRLVQWNQFAIQTFLIVDDGESIKTLFHDFFKLAAKDSYSELIWLNWNLFHKKTRAFMCDAVKSIQHSYNVRSIARAVTKDLHDCTTANIKVVADKIHAFVQEWSFDASVGSAITFRATLVLQWTILMIVASTMAWFLLRTAWTLCRGMIVHQAMAQTVPIRKTVKISDMDLSAFGYDYEITNVFVAFDPISFLFFVNDGIDLCGSCIVESQFIGPAFLEMRDLQSEIDDDDEYESTNDFDSQDLLGSFSKLSSKDDSSKTVKNRTFRDSEMDDLVTSFAKLSFKDGIDTRFIGPTFAKMRDPHKDELDDDDEDQATKDLKTTQRDDLLGSFSNLSAAKKAVSASEMDDLVSAFANL